MLTHHPRRKVYVIHTSSGYYCDSEWDGDLFTYTREEAKLYDSVPEYVHPHTIEEFYVRDYECNHEHIFQKEKNGKHKAICKDCGAMSEYKASYNTAYNWLLNHPSSGIHKDTV